MTSPRARVKWLSEAFLSPGVGGVLARGSIGSFVVKVSATALLFGMHVLLARVLGVTSYGNFVYAITWVQVLALFSAAGMDSASTRYVAEYQAREEPALLAGLLRHARALALTASVTVAVALFVIITALEPRLDQELAWTLRWGAVLVPIATLLEVRSGALRGFKRVVLARLPTDVLRPVFVSAGASACYFLARDALDAPMVMVVNIAAVGVGLAVVELLLRRLRGTPRLAEASATLPRREWAGVGFQLLLVTGFGLVLGQTDTLMLGALRSTADAGVYAVAVRLAGFISFALVSVNVMIGPQIAELHAAGRRRELQRVLTLGARVSLGFGIPTALALLAAGPVALGIFGPEFRVGLPALVVLTAGQVANCAAGSVGMLLTMIGRQRTVAWVLGLSALANIALNAALIPRYGMLGAATATAITTLAWNVMLVVRALQTEQFNTTPISLRMGR